MWLVDQFILPSCPSQSLAIYQTFRFQKIPFTSLIKSVGDATIFFFLQQSDEPVNYVSHK